MRRSALLAPALVAALAGALLTASPASADAGSCAVTVAQPASLTITSSLMRVPVELRSAPSGCLAFASFNVLRGDGADSSSAIFDQAQDDSWLLGSDDGAGHYRLALDYAHDQSGDAVTVQSLGPQLDARFASSLSGVKVKRAGSKAKLSVTAKQYRYFAGYVAARSRKVVFEKRTGSGWVAVKTVSTDRKGTAAATLRAPRSTKWRARLLDSGSAWGATSGSRTPSGPTPVVATPIAPTPPPPPAPVLPACPSGRLYGAPTSATAADRGSYSSYYDVTITGYIRNDADHAVELDDFGPEVSGYDAAGYKRFSGYASSNYPDQYLSASGTFVLQPGASVGWTDTELVLKSDWPQVRAIAGSPTEEYTSDWAGGSVSSSCPGPEQDYATRTLLHR